MDREASMSDEWGFSAWKGEINNGFFRRMIGFRNKIIDPLFIADL